MIGMRGRTTVLVVALSGGVLAGCSSGATPLGADQVDEILTATASDGYDSATVGEVLARAPDGAVGMLDVRIAMGVDDAQHVVIGTPPVDFHDWLVVGACGYPDELPSIEVAAIPPQAAAALEDARTWNLMCDGPDANPPG